MMPVSWRQCDTRKPASSARPRGRGVGWLAEEFDALGIPFAQRGKRTEAYVGAMRALWEQDEPAYAGDYVRFQGACMRPKPYTGTVPIVIGGHFEATARGAPHDLARIPDLAAAGIGRVLVPVTANAGLSRPISGLEDLLAWRDVIARYADGPAAPMARIRR